MYAIFSDGGRQYKVQEGQILLVDYREMSDGAAVTFDQVLACGEGDALRLGTPTVKGAQVTGKVLGTTQGPKLVVQKLRRRKNSRRRTGHRQLHTRVRIEKIHAG